MPTRKPRAKPAPTPTPSPITVERVEQESRREKFLRLGQHRMENALHTVRLIGNLASPTYEWHESDIAQMYATLQSCIEDNFARFRKERPPKLEETFKLGVTTETKLTAVE